MLLTLNIRAGKKYFQFHFVEIELADVLISEYIRFVPAQINVRSNGVNPRKYIASIEHEKNKDSNTKSCSYL